MRQIRFIYFLKKFDSRFFIYLSPGDLSKAKLNKIVWRKPFKMQPLMQSYFKLHYIDSSKFIGFFTFVISWYPLNESFKIIQKT